MLTSNLQAYYVIVLVCYCCQVKYTLGITHCKKGKTSLKTPKTALLRKKGNRFLIFSAFSELKAVVSSNKNQYVNLWEEL